MYISIPFDQNILQVCNRNTFGQSITLSRGGPLRIKNISVNSTGNRILKQRIALVFNRFSYLLSYRQTSLLTLMTTAVRQTWSCWVWRN